VEGLTFVRISPNDGEIAAVNRRFIGAGSKRVFEAGEIVLQPPHTTTYRIAGELPGQGGRYASRQVTVTVDDPDPQGGPCRPATFNAGRLSEAGDTIEVSIIKTCVNRRIQDRWTIAITHSTKSTPSRTYNYTAMIPAESEVMQKLANNGLSSTAAQAIVSGVYPALRQGNSQQVSRAIQRMLRRVN
jgi:hypothetical protein